MYLNPEHMTFDQQRRVANWLEANGCRDFVALEPIVVRGKVIEYVSLGRKARFLRAAHPELLTCRRRRMRIRIPLSAIH